MWTMKGDFVVPQYYNKWKVFEEEMYASLIAHLSMRNARNTMGTRGTPE